MKLNLAESFGKHAAQNRFKYISITAALFLGLITGAVFGSNGSISSGYAENFISMYKLQGAASSQIFTYSFISYLRLAAIIWIAGRFMFLIPLIYIQVAAKGFGIGCTISYIVSVFGVSGTVFCFLSMFMQNVIFIPALIIYSVHRINFAAAYRTVRSSPSAFKQRRKLNTEDLEAFLIFFAAAMLCTCIEAYVVPPLIKPFCTKFM